MQALDARWLIVPILALTCSGALAQIAGRPAGGDPALIGWWAFDEQGEEPLARDGSGLGLDAQLLDARVSAGFEGGALECDGGCAVVPSSEALNVGEGLTISCRIRTDIAGQDNRWIVNRVYEAGDAGYRLGILGGKPCFHVPATAWSHHLSGDTRVPTGRWVHLAGTFDGQRMRLWMDGVLVGEMVRPGPVGASAYPLTLGNYEPGHAAFYRGWLDDVRLYKRALSAEEIVQLAGSTTPPTIRIPELLLDRPMTRVGRSIGMLATLANETGEPQDATVTLELPEGVRCAEGEPTRTCRIEAWSEAEVRVTLEADRELRGDLKLRVSVGGMLCAERELGLRFLPAAPIAPGPIPDPVVAPTELLIGAHHCPLWEADKPGMWSNILLHPDRTPALGFYAGENPEVADWETKWAVEHGVSFFIYCWYRTSQGGPVTTQFEPAITTALRQSRFRSKMHYTIMWENQSHGRAGVSDLRDLQENLFPYWMETFFRDPGYLVVDNKPVLFVYRPEFLVEDLGSVEAVVRAFDWMREACREAGFDGLTILGEYRGLDPNHLELMKSLGLDYSFAYCWHVADSPEPERAIATQLDYIQRTQELGVLPQVVTVTQGWSGWRDEGSIWKLPPADWERLLREAKDFVTGLPEGQLSSRMLLLDNWNEWGEGHYISPHTDNGFGYLDAVRRVFSSAPEEHTDLIPEDLGLGPYDAAYREALDSDRVLRRALGRAVTRPGAEDPSLIGWWTFDEPEGEDVILDWSGHRLGGKLVDARTVPGFEGAALECDGGCAVVPSRRLLNPNDGLTISCRVCTDVAGQDQSWIVNRVYESGDAGYRLGLLGGKPCFHVPLTSWSHHLSGNVDLPTGRWVHLAATFDGQTMRLWMDGVLVGEMERPGLVGTSTYPLTLGSYEQGHASFYRGLLDDVRLYNRALSEEEIARLAGGR